MKTLIVLAFVSVIYAQAPGDLPPAPGRHVISLPPNPGRFSEPSIAVNPANPQQVAVAYQSGASVGYSTDGGEHWTIAEGTAPKEYRSSGDVSIVYDRQGHAILCFIAMDALGSWRYWGHGATRNGIFVRRSPDGGKTWESRAIPVIEHATEPGIPFEDKPYIVADNQPKSPYAGNLYVGWTQDRLADALMLLASSTDGGLTWSAPVRLSDRAGLPRDDDGTVEGFSGIVTPDGALHVIWSDTNHIVYAVSHDGGKSFSRNRLIADTAPSHFIVFNANHANGYPQIDMATDKDGAHPRLYVTWSDYRNGDVDIFCISSADGGKTWSREVRVNSDPLHNGADQLFQWLAVDPTSGAVNVMFYDRRRDPANRAVDVVLARSTDGGRTFRNYLLSERSYDPMGSEIGDYTALAAYGGRVYGSWTEIVQTPGAAPQAGATARWPAIIRVGMADFRGVVAATGN